MNRRNYTVHFALAAALVMFAALAGQVTRWESKRTSCTVSVRRPVLPPAGRGGPLSALEEARGGDADVLVRFREGVSEERIQAIAARLNDRVEDEIESVN